MTRIAIIDDDQSHLDLAAILFGSRDWTTTTVPEGTALVDSLRCSRPDAILLDIRLGRGQSGWDILDQLQSEPETNAIPVVIWSADIPGINEKRDWLERRGIPVLSKPFEIDDLFRCVEQVLPEDSHRETDLLERSA